MEEASHFKNSPRPVLADNLPELLESLLITEDKTLAKKLFNSTSKDSQTIRASWFFSQEETANTRRARSMTQLLNNWSQPTLKSKTKLSTSSKSQESRQDKPQLSWQRTWRMPEFTERFVNCRSTRSTRASERRELRKLQRNSNELINRLDFQSLLTGTL